MYLEEVKINTLVINFGGRYKFENKIKMMFEYKSKYEHFVMKFKYPIA